MIIWAHMKDLFFALIFFACMWLVFSPQAFALFSKELNKDFSVWPASCQLIYGDSPYFK